MYVPDKWSIKDPKIQNQFIHQHSFASLISPSLQSSRLPLLLDEDKGLIYGHFSRANPHWKEVENQTCLAIFDGAHSYISPTWYQGHPAVPTWNYVSIHVKGTVSLLSSAETHEVLNRLMQKYEPSLVVKREIVTAEYQDKLNKGIVGFSLKIETIDAKAKLGQHRNIADQTGVVKGLKNSTSLESQALLALMQTLKLGLG